MAGRLSNREIITAWWPLAASWLLMSAELPMVSACVARMPEASLQLAAFGSIVFPLALVIEGPVIMMLAAATALAEHPENLRRLWRFMHQLGLLLTVIHAIFAFTPLLDVVVINMMGAPEELVEPTRLGVRLMLPWSWLIADRRFHQGVLIRHGYSRTVGIGTAVRLISTLSMLFVGYQLQWGSGVAVACSTLSGAVFAEAIYVRWAIWKFGAIEDIPEVDVPPMSFKDLVTFYWPLALSPLVALIALPIGSSGVSRMPESLYCLAAWPALNGLSFMSRSAGIAFNEVVVSFSGREKGDTTLGYLGWTGGLIASILLLFVCMTPMSAWWFQAVIGLDEELVVISVRALWFSVPLPLLTFVRSFYQGQLVACRETRGITEAVLIQVGVVAGILWMGVQWQGPLGIDVAMVAFTVGTIFQVGWLRWRVFSDVAVSASS